MDGDTVVIDFGWVHRGAFLDGRKRAENFELKLGSGQFNPGLAIS